MALRATLMLLLGPARSSRAALSITLLVVAATGCRKTYVDADKNRVPVAVARAYDPSGEPVDSTANDGVGPVFPFSGQPVEVRLNGTASTDMDGTIAAYRWLSATQRDGGAGRIVAEGAEPDWPDDEAEPRVTLGEGAWSFALWVTDDRGAISNPDTIDLIVGEPPDVDAGP